ncbi:cytochrome D1 domain-containing protein [Thalassobacillus devorans]|uniref:YVTN family beta-propeller repeat protein n=1 Tax=Thalassobacillus devorans TaxID=279813 RepID=UPI00048B3DA5|nr:YncE family protein [Thalassobacillus devorans]
MKKNMLGILSGLVLFIIILGGCGTSTPSDEASEQNTVKASENQEVAGKGKRRFYFTADEGGSVTKIDATDNTVVDSLSVDGTVHNVQVSPDGKTLGMTVIPGGEGHDNTTEGEDKHSDTKADTHENDGMNGVAMFYDLEEDRWIEKVEVGSHPAHIDFTGDQRYALVTNNESNTVSIIDTSNYQVVDTVDTGKGPHGFRIASEGSIAYVANMGENTISIIDLKTMKEEKRIQVGGAPVTTAITSDGKTLVTTLHTENKVAIVDLETDEIIKTEVGEGPAQVYIQSNDQYAFIANQGSENAPADSVTKIDLSTGEAIATIQTGKGTHGVVISPDDRYIYVTNMFEDTVSVIQNEKNKVIKTIEVGSIPNGISIMP